MLNLRQFRKDNCLTQQDIAKYLGVGISFISKVETGNSQLPEDKLSKLYDNDKGWDTKSLNIGSSNTATEERKPDMVPVIPENLYKEVNIDILDYLRDGAHKIRTTPAVQQFPTTTCFYVVHTIAMYPHLHEGDILALKALPPTAPIVNGELYAVDTSDLGLVIRFAYDRGEYIEMKAQQERFETFQIQKETVYTIFRIVGLIRSNI